MHGIHRSFKIKVRYVHNIGFTIDMTSLCSIMQTEQVHVNHGNLSNFHADEDLNRIVHRHQQSKLKEFKNYSFPGAPSHYTDVIMRPMASQITSLTIVYSTVYSDADQRKHQSPASLAFVRGIHRGPLNSPHKWPVTRKMFPFDDVIMVLID